MRSFLLVTLALLFDASPALAQTGAPQPTSFYKRFEGTIGTSAIVMNLVKTPLGAKGNYYYVNVQQPIQLWESWRLEESEPPAADSLIFTEYASNADTSSAVLSLHFSASDAIEGSWVREGKTLPIDLHENYPVGTITLDPYWYVDSTVIKIPKNHRGSAVSTSVVLLLPPNLAMSASAQQAYRNAIGEVYGCNSAADNEAIRTCVRANARTYCDSTRAELLDMSANFADSNLSDDMLEWFERTDMVPRFNDADLLMLDIHEAEYMGGAHGLDGCGVVALDLASGKRLKLTDVTAADSATLEKLLTKAARKQFHIDQGQLLSDFLFENRLPANDNFYVTKRGLGFVYNPYEVAPFAQGIIDVFLPYSALKGKLTAWFVKRMGL